MKKKGIEYVSVGEWSKVKYKILENYCAMFTGAMKGKWDKLVYIDLFSSSGKAIIKGTGEEIDTSPLIAYKTKTPFDKYIFCDENKGLVDSLRKELESYQPRNDYECIHGNCNEKVSSIIDSIPREEKTLSFCFVDPYGLNIDFATIETLSKERKIDFIILLALPMDAIRNTMKYYIKDEHKRKSPRNRGDVWIAK